MRILQVFNSYLQRGGEEVWVEELPSLLGDSFEVRELRFRSSEWLGPGTPSKLRQIRWIGDNPHSRSRLREAVAQWRPDVLLFHNLIPVASLGLYDEARRLGLPVAQYLHNFRPFSPSGTLWVNGRVDDAALRGNSWPEILGGAWNGSRVKTAVLAWHLGRLRRSGALDAVKVWIAISAFMRDKFVAAGIPAERIALLPHCWDAPGTLSSAPEADHYIFLGRLYRSKGVDTLLEAWRMLERRMGGETPRLVICGEGPLAPQVQEAAATSDRIEFAGFVDGERKQNLLATCRALIAPSAWWEPLGLIVHEAYSHARPVIAARSGGLAETVAHGSTGLIFTPGDAHALAQSVVDMDHAGSSRRTEMGASGYRWLQENCSPTTWRKEFSRAIRGRG